MAKKISKSISWRQRIKLFSASKTGAAQQQQARIIDNIWRVTPRIARAGSAAGVSGMANIRRRRWLEKNWRAGGQARRDRRGAQWRWRHRAA